MNRGRLVASMLTCLLLSQFCMDGQCQTSDIYELLLDGEIVQFVPAQHRGYVVKTPRRNPLIRQKELRLMAESPTFPVPEDATSIGGTLWGNTWIVHGEKPSVQSKSLHDVGNFTYMSPLFSVNGDTVAVIPEIVVCVEPGIEMDDVLSLCETLSLAAVKPMEFTTQEYLLEVLAPDADAVFAAVRELREIDWVAWAYPNTVSQLKLCGQVIPDDEYFPMQWHLYNTGQTAGTPGADINALEAWEITTGDPNIIIAIVDSGVDINHPDLIDNLASGYDFWEDDDTPEPSHEHFWDAHGTACAGLVAAKGNNAFGVTGVTWDCRIMPIRTSDPDARGISFETQAQIADAFRWAAVNGADILSNSWVWGESPTPIIHSAIVDITELNGMGRDGKGCLVLFAAGNQGGDLRYPKLYPEVITVGATDDNNMRYSYSNFGPRLDIVAPSGFMKGTPPLPVWTTDIIGLPGLSSNPVLALDSLLDYAGFGGTSMACPIAAGVAALMLSVEPNLTNVEVRHFLERSAKDLGDPGWDEYYGWGRVDARAALDMILAKRADLDDDWCVNFDDLLILIELWGTDDPLADIAPATERDGVVDDQDLELMMRYYDVEIPKTEVE